MKRMKDSRNADDFEAVAQKLDEARQFIEEMSDYVYGAHDQKALLEIAQELLDLEFSVRWAVEEESA